jgi:hypothetical protein
MGDDHHGDGRCYGCGRPLAAAEAVTVDLASAGRAFTESVRMHESCARRYLPVECRDRWRGADAETRRRLAHSLRERGHTQRAIAAALGVSQHTVRIDLAGG